MDPHGDMGDYSASEQAQLNALRRIDALSKKLQEEGKLLEALQCMEKSLILRGHCFGLDSIEVYRACKSVGEMCNYLAMTYLNSDKFDITLELLKKAEVLTERHRAVRAVTFNNFGCYFRKRGKLRTALSYVRRALKIESKLNNNVKAADTHINMCTILSELRRHEKALIHARTALKLLLLELFGPNGYTARQAQERQERLRQKEMARQQRLAERQQRQLQRQQQGQGDDYDEEERDEEEDEEEEDDGKPQLPADRVAVLAIAYHNLAVQEEFLRRYEDSLNSYEKACKVVTTHLEASHPLVKNLTDSFKEAKRKLTVKIERQNQIISKARSGRMRGANNAGATRAMALSADELRVLQSGLEDDGNDNGHDDGHDDGGEHDDDDGGDDGEHDGEHDEHDDEHDDDGEHDEHDDDGEHDEHDDDGSDME